MPFVIPAIIGAIFGLTVAGGHSDWPKRVMAAAASMFATTFFFGWRMIRNDLRHDMVNLSFLKTLPISSSEIVLAEVASAMLPLVVVEFALGVVTYIGAELTSIPPLSPPLTPQLRLMFLVVSPVALIALNGALLTIQNATAVLFPAWVRLGPTVTGGVEALGQNVLSFAGIVFCLVLGLIVPMFVATIVSVAMRDQAVVGLATAIITGSILLAAETYGVIHLLGRAFDRAEPAAT